MSYPENGKKESYYDSKIGRHVLTHLPELEGMLVVNSNALFVTDSCQIFRATCPCFPEPRAQVLRATVR